MRRARPTPTGRKRNLSPIDGIVLGGLLGSLILLATIQLPSDGGGRPPLRILVAAGLASAGLSVFAAQIIRSGWTTGLRLLTPLAVGTLVVWIVIAVHLVHGGGAP
jgi:hypothetical protein